VHPNQPTSRNDVPSKQRLRMLTLLVCPIDTNSPKDPGIVARE
jgi:hypothetical protein